MIADSRKYTRTKIDNLHVYSGSIKYTISKLTQQVHDSFTIGEDSGRITSKSTLDRETEDFYNFVVEATDELGRQGMAAIQVNSAEKMKII